MPQITIAKIELDKFLALSTYTDLTQECIQLLPDTEYIKIEMKKGFCSMSLTSSSSFVTYMFSSPANDDCTMLVSILSLREFFKVKRKDQITIDDSSDSTKITDGNYKLEKGKNLEIKLEYFMQIPSTKGCEFKRFSKDIILKLIQSKKYIETKDTLRPILNVTSIKKDMMMSTDASISCFYKLESEFGFEVLSPKEIDLISSFEYADYFKTDNWSIIKYKTIVYGSRLTEGLNPGSMHESLDGYIKTIEKDKVLKVNVQQMTDFCNSVKASAKDFSVSSNLEVVENGVKLSYEDPNNNVRYAEQIVAATIIGYEIGYSYKIYQFKIMKVLDSLNSEFINISECVNGNGDKGYIAFWLDIDSSFHSICTKAI